MGDYIFAIGGTGARCVESVVHLCDCGYMPLDKLKVAIIDSDSNCGNTRKTEKLINDYQKCRAFVNKDDDDMFKTDIVTAFAENSAEDKAKKYVMSPVVTENAEIFSIDNDLAGISDREAINLMKNLYSKDEFNKNITEGFYAHPSIGSLIFIRWLRSSPEIKKIITAMKTEAATLHENINIFIIGSAFGGTGASGFPALARYFIEELKQAGGQVHLSGCFLLPYFSFRDPNGTDKERTIRTDTFNVNTKNALMFYNSQDLLAQFKSVYLLGDAKMVARGLHSEAGKDQENWPHYVEVFSAMAAKDFFEKQAAQTDEETANSKTELFTTAVASAANIGWADLLDDVALKNLLQDFTMFNYNYSINALPHFMDVSSDMTWEFKKEKSVTLGAFKEKFFQSNGLFSPKTIPQEIKKEDFRELYNYLTEQAKWLYKITHDYKEELCDSCTAENCGKSVNDFSSCRGHQFISQLFGSEMLFRRAYALDYMRRNSNVSNIFELLNDYFIGSDSKFTKFNEGASVGYNASVNGATMFNLIDKKHNKKTGNPKDELKEFIREIYEVGKNN